MAKVLAVAWRDFKHTALTKTFIFAGIVMPLFMFGVIFLIGALFKPNFQPLTGTIGIIDDTGDVVRAATHELSEDRLKQRIRDIMRDFTEEASPASATQAAATAAAATLPVIDLKIQQLPSPENNEALQALKARVRKGDLAALVIVPPELLEPRPAAQGHREPSIDVFIPSGFAPNHTRLIQGGIRDAVVRARIERAGQEYESVQALVSRPETEPKRLSADGGEAAESVAAKMFIPMAFMMLLWITTFTSGNYLLTSTIEEKSNKVMEVLLSAVSPMQLMTGKILGQAGVSAMMMIVYAGLGVTSLTFLAMMDLVPLAHLLYLALYFIMAYFMVAAIMAGVGSAVSDMRDAQSLITPAMLVLMIPLMLWLPISENPNGTLATVTSFIPPLTPFVMILRVTAASEPVALGQILASLVWGYVAMIIMVWMAARIFRVGVLMYGKPPNPIELLKWLRYT